MSYILRKQKSGDKIDMQKFKFDENCILDNINQNKETMLKSKKLNIFKSIQ